MKKPFIDNDKSKKHSVLIIDDEKLSINVLVHILQRDYLLHTTKEGKIGVEIANEFLPDVILLDIVMPDMDGFEALSLLKSSDRTKNIPVIIITGLRDGEDIEKFAALGVADYIFKPVNAAQVKEKVYAQVVKA